MCPCRSLSHVARSVLLTSGTLSPLDSFSGELGLDFHVRLEAPHVVDVNRQVNRCTVCQQTDCLHTAAGTPPLIRVRVGTKACPLRSQQPACLVRRQVQRRQMPSSAC